MEFDIQGIEINNEQDFIKLVRDLNTQIEFKNRFAKGGEQEKLIDEKVALKRYREISYRENRRKFRIEHECLSCIDYQLRQCKGIPPCRYEDGFEREEIVHEKRICPNDKNGDCPYGRPEGICIGPCFREIMEDFKGGNGRNESSKENSCNG